MSMKGPTQRNHFGCARNVGANAALYMTWRLLMTRTAEMIAQSEAVPAMMTIVSWAAPANIKGDVSQAAHSGISDLVIARPSTNPNGIAGISKGIASVTACRSTRPWRVGDALVSTQRTVRHARGFASCGLCYGWCRRHQPRWGGSSLERVRLISYRSPGYPVALFEALAE